MPVTAQFTYTITNGTATITGYSGPGVKEWGRILVAFHMSQFWLDAAAACQIVWGRIAREPGIDRETVADVED